MLIAKSRAQIQLIPAGTYVATCCGVIDLGTHPNPVFGGDRHKILLQWEVPELRAEYGGDGAKLDLPRVISKRYTLSLSEKANLRRDLESWRGRKFTNQELQGFDLRALLGTACQLQIINETGKDGSKTFASVTTIMALPKGTRKPKPENPVQFFSFEEAGANPSLPADLPEWITKLIQESSEWRGATAEPAGASTGNEDPDASEEVPAF